MEAFIGNKPEERRFSLSVITPNRHAAASGDRASRDRPWTLPTAQGHAALTTVHPAEWRNVVVVAVSMEWKRTLDNRSAAGLDNG